MMRRARLPLALLALKPQQQLLPFQYLKYLLHTLAFTVIWNSRLTVINHRSASAAVMRFIGLKLSMHAMRSSSKSLSNPGRAFCCRCSAKRFLRVGGDMNCVRT